MIVLDRIEKVGSKLLFHTKFEDNTVFVFVDTWIRLEDFMRGDQKEEKNKFPYNKKYEGGTFPKCCLLGCRD